MQGAFRANAMAGQGGLLGTTIAELMVLASPTACATVGLSAISTPQELDQVVPALLEHTIRENMGRVMQLNYSFWRDKLCLSRSDETMCDGWCEGQRAIWRSALHNGSELDTSSARVVALPERLELFRTRQRQSKLTPVVAWHSTPTSDAKSGILETGFLAAKDSGTQHFGGCSLPTH